MNHENFAAQKSRIVLTLSIISLILLGYIAATPHFIYIGPPRPYHEPADPDGLEQDPNNDCVPDEISPWFPSCDGRVQLVL